MLHFRNWEFSAFSEVDQTSRARVRANPLRSPLALASLASFVRQCTYGESTSIFFFILQVPFPLSMIYYLFEQSHTHQPWELCIPMCLIQAATFSSRRPFGFPRPLPLCAFAPPLLGNPLPRLSTLSLPAGRPPRAP